MPLSRLSHCIAAAFATFVVGAAVSFSPASAQDTQDTQQIKRGEYIFNLSGCAGCHTDKKGGGKPLAGGRAFKTDFGTFYSPNITPAPNFGIGAWTFENFTDAMRHGQAPDGRNYFPAFPYTSYTHMSDADLADLWSYVRVQPAFDRKNQPHDLKPPYGWRWLMSFWNVLYLDAGPKPQWSRGRYLAEALSHCHECHTPRNFLGGYDSAKRFAGTPRNPEGIVVPNITPDTTTGIGKWSDGDLDLLFTIGMLPDGDFVSGVMSESVTHATSKMTKNDLSALIKHLRSLPPVVSRVKVPKPQKSGDEDWQ